MPSFQQSRPKLALLAVLFGAVALLLAFMAFVCAFLPGLWAYLGLSLFGPLALASAAAAVSSGLSFAHPATLTVDQGGVSYRSYRKALRLRWSEIAAFAVFSPEGRLRSPGCELTEPVAGRRFISFGRSWEKTPEDIVEALTAARPGAVQA